MTNMKNDAHMRQRHVLQKPDCAMRIEDAIYRLRTRFSSVSARGFSEIELLQGLHTALFDGYELRDHENLLPGKR